VLIITYYKLCFMAIEKTDIQTDAQMKSYAKDEMSIARQTRD